MLSKNVVKSWNEAVECINRNDANGLRELIPLQLSADTVNDGYNLLHVALAKEATFEVIKTLIDVEVPVNGRCANKSLSTLGLALGMYKIDKGLALRELILGGAIVTDTIEGSCLLTDLNNPSVEFFNPGVVQIAHDAIIERARKVGYVEKSLLESDYLAKRPELKGQIERAAMAGKEEIEIVAKEQLLRQAEEERQAKQLEDDILERKRKYEEELSCAKKPSVCNGNLGALRFLGKEEACEEKSSLLGDISSNYGAVNTEDENKSKKQDVTSSNKPPSATDNCSRKPRKILWFFSSEKKFKFKI